MACLSAGGGGGFGGGHYRYSGGGGGVWKARLVGGRYGSGSAKVPNSAASQLVINKAAGDAFEKQVMGKVQQTQSNVVQQVTAKTQSGVRIRFDLMGRDANGNIVCTECKSSATARLTKNQAAAFPEIQQTGATVVGKGKPGFPGGTVISPTIVHIVRPTHW